MAKGGATKTKIATKLGLNFQRASEQVECLYSNDYLQKFLAESQISFVLTEKGRIFLSRLELIEHDLDELLRNPRLLETPLKGQIFQFDAGDWRMQERHRRKEIR